MKPISILHKNFRQDGVDVVIEVYLTKEDKEMIHKVHIDCGNLDYDVYDVSMLVWIFVNDNNEINGYTYNEYSAVYYPAEQGEILYDNDLLPDGFEQECIQFVKDNYIGNENDFYMF